MGLRPAGRVGWSRPPPSAASTGGGGCHPPPGERGIAVTPGPVCWGRGSPGRPAERCPPPARCGPAAGQGLPAPATPRTAPPPRSAARCCGSFQGELAACAGLARSFLPPFFFSFCWVFITIIFFVVLTAFLPPGSGEPPQTSRLIPKRFPAGQCERRRTPQPPSAPAGAGRGE